jgi:hypothetical protein
VRPRVLRRRDQLIDRDLLYGSRRPGDGPRFAVDDFGGVLIFSPTLEVFFSGAAGFAVDEFSTAAVGFVICVLASSNGRAAE